MRIEASGERGWRLALSDEAMNEQREADRAIRGTRQRLGLRKAEVMNATLPYRIASGLLVVFAASHTSGLLTFDESSSEVRGVREAMDHVHFQLMGSNCSYGGLYVGFGLLLTAYLLFSAFLAWHLGGLARRNPQAIGALAWSLFTVQVVNLALSWMYFFPAPVAMSALVAICLGWAAWLVPGAKARA
jgi:hypothetical protein